MKGDPGFTPAPDCIRDDIDATAALVFGSVWRWCQMNRHECNATVEQIAKRAGVSATTARNRLGALVDRGWLASEERTGQPTIYRDHGRWQIKPTRALSSTPTGDVGVPQRETLGGATGDVGVPQRETLGSYNKEEERSKERREEGATPASFAKIPDDHRALIPFPPSSPDIVPADYGDPSSPVFKAVARSMMKHERVLDQRLALQVAAAVADIQAIAEDEKTDITAADIEAAAAEFMRGLEYKPAQDRRPPTATQIVQAVGTYILQRDQPRVMNEWGM